MLASACGEGANCVARNNRAQCSCPEDFLGDGHSRCYTECTTHQECDASKVSSVIGISIQWGWDNDDDLVGRVDW